MPTTLDAHMDVDRGEGLITEDEGCFIDLEAQNLGLEEHKPSASQFTNSSGTREFLIHSTQKLSSSLGISARAFKRRFEVVGGVGSCQVAGDDGGKRTRGKGPRNFAKSSLQRG